MSKLVYSIFVFALLIVVVGVGCQVSSSFECVDATGCVDIAPGEPLKLGVLQALSGGAAANGAAQVRGIELALAAEDNQLLGHPIELIIEDEGCTSEGGTMGVLKIVADPQVVGIIGTTCSGAATTASRLMSEAGVVMVSGVNTSPSLTAVNGIKGAYWQPGYLRTAHNDAIAAQSAATFVYEHLGITKVATINDGDSYTRGFTEQFEAVFSELGGEVVLETAVNKGDENMEPVLTAVANSGAQLLFFPVFSPEADYLILQAKELPQLENVILLSGSAALSTDLIQNVGEAGVGLNFSIRFVPESAAFEDLLSMYEAQFDLEPRAYAFIYVYDATHLLLNGIKQVAVQDDDGTLHIGRQALRDALYATENFEGVAGTYSCDEFGDCSDVKFVVSRLDDPEMSVEDIQSNIVYTFELEP